MYMYMQAVSEGAFGPYGRGPEHILRFPVKPIMKQDKILKSLVEVAENLNLKPEQAIELSSIKNSLKLSW